MSDLGQHSSAALTPTVIDLPALSVNFPPSPEPELIRHNVLNTLENLVRDSVYAAAVEGEDGIGKTTVLAQFARRHSSKAVSLFISAANRLSYDIDLIRFDIATQVYWAITKDVLIRDRYDPALLKSYYSDLQRHAKHAKSPIYFIVDGLDELTPSMRDQILQQLADVLPVGITQFRFLFSGDESLYKPLLGPQLAIKSYPLTEFSVDEARSLLSGKVISQELAIEVNLLCRGMPGRLASARRAMDKGLTAEDLVKDAPTKWPEFFEIDWSQVDQSDENLAKTLALIAHDPKPHTLSDLAEILKLSDTEVLQCLGKVNFLSRDAQSGVVRFASAGLMQYVAERLRERKPQIQKLLIKRLLAAPTSEQSLTDLPMYLEEASQYPDLVDLLTPDHILQVLERTQTLSRVDDAVQRGFRSAKKLGRDPDVLRFCLQQSVVADVAFANAWESEVAALAALRHDHEALALANSAVLREDRLLMLATLAHGIWLRGDTVESELLESIRLLIDNLDYWSLGRRAEPIASKLTCVSPDLAMTLLRKAKRGNDDGSLDRAFVSLAVSALTDVKDDRRRDQAIETASRSRQDPIAKSLLEGVRVLSGRLDPQAVCERAKDIENAEARLGILRYWCALNGTKPGADVVAHEAIQLALGSRDVRIDASLLLDLSRAVAGAATEQGRRKLISVLDGVRATAERLGPSVDYVGLQGSLAIAEASLDAAACEGRLSDTFEYIARIGDLPSRGESYARFLGTLRQISKVLVFTSGDSLERACADELESVVLMLAESTADHRLSLGGVITGLIPGDLAKALDYTRLLNTEHRRNAVLVDVIRESLRRSISEIEPADMKTVLDSLTSQDERDEALVLIIERFADAQSIPELQLSALLPLIRLIEDTSDSVVACRGLVHVIKILDASGSHGDLRDRLSSLLMHRWEHIDVGWLRIDAGFGIARDLAATNAAQAEAMLKAAEDLKAGSSISAPLPAATYVACVRLVIRAFSGLLPRRLETDVDVGALAALIDVLPSYGERALLWADVCMRAAIAGRSDLTEKLAGSYLLPAFRLISPEDRSYRTSVLIRISPAIYKAQPTTCLDELERLSQDDRDMAVREIIRFTVFNRVPSDPVDRSRRNAAAITPDVLLRVESLTQRLGTDWMIYTTVEDIAEALDSTANKHSLNVPQREDFARRFVAIANAKLPVARQIAHPGYRIVTVAQAFRLAQTKPSDWSALIEEAKTLTNVADRVYVLQIVALALPRSMSAVRAKLLDQAKREIAEIPSTLDQIERYLGLAEELQRTDAASCRELVTKASQAIAQATEDVNDQRRRLVDIAYRIDEEFAKRLIDAFDDDDAKRYGQAQLRLLEIRNSITKEGGRPDHNKILSQIRARDLSRLGVLFLRALNSDRVQSYHPSEIREYLDLAAGHPLRRAYALLTWYVENAVARFARTDQAAAFLRPLFDACVVGADLAGRVAGRSMIRLKAIKNQSGQISATRSLLATPGSRSEAIGVLSAWFERNLDDVVLIHDPYFGPEEVDWLQIIRSARPDCVITVMAARQHQPKPSEGLELADLYSLRWRNLYDQQPPKAEIAVIGGEVSGGSPIHDRWLVSGGAGLRFGTSLNFLGLSKDSEISEMSPEDVEQKRLEMLQYLNRERTEYKGEKLRLVRFWL